MTDISTLADYNIKDYGKLSGNHKVPCYLYPTDIVSESIPSCSDRVCLECANDHSFRGNIKDAITFINLLPEIFKENRNTTKLQEFVN